MNDARTTPEIAATRPLEARRWRVERGLVATYLHERSDRHRAGEGARPAGNGGVEPTSRGV
jgi:hypothetical protein